MKNLKTLVLGLIALVPLAAGAQSVNHRLHEQHERIVQGVHSGALTRREAARLRFKEANIRARERRARMMHHGHLTWGQRARLQRAENHVSRDIYRQKHDWQRRHR